METLKRDKLYIKGINKSYGEKEILKNLNFSVKNGEFLSVLGPSGCGKTTLLRILTGLVKPTSGQIFKEGKEITNNHPSNRGMGIVFQNYALFENMNVLENVYYALKAKKEEKYMDKAIDLLRRVGLEDLALSMPHTLSGGQQQRVAIARTMVLNPEIVLFDEPMSALDVDTRLILRKLIKEIQKEYSTTMIYITHDQEEAFTMSDRILVMDIGNIVQIDSPEDIIAKPANDYVKKFVINNLQEKMNALSKFMVM